MGNLDINTSFNMLNSLENFTKSINGFNNFDTAIKKDNIGSTNFDDVLNSVKQNSKNQISESEKMAQDISFGFKNGLSKLNEVEKKAETDFETFASGGDISIHEVMISAQKSSLSMQMALQLRNQMLNAYNEFKNMQF